MNKLSDILEIYKINLQLVAMREKPSNELDLKNLQNDISKLPINEQARLYKDLRREQLKYKRIIEFNDIIINDLSNEAKLLGEIDET